MIDNKNPVHNHDYNEAESLVKLVELLREINARPINPQDKDSDILYLLDKDGNKIIL